MKDITMRERWALTFALEKYFNFNPKDDYIKLLGHDFTPLDDFSIRNALSQLFDVGLHTPESLSTEISSAMSIYFKPVKLQALASGVSVVKKGNVI